MNRFIQFDYHDQQIPIINNDENNDISTLDSAVQPILSKVENLNHYVEKAKNARGKSSTHGLTDDESAAVYLYADDWNQQSLHRLLNEALQSGNEIDVKPWFGFFKLFENALKKLPIVKETIYRRLPVDIANQLNVNQELVCWTFISCSTSVDIIKSMTNENSVLCSIEPINAKNVSNYTPTPDDLEVLLLPGTRFRVKSKEFNNEMGSTVVSLEEISNNIDVDMKSPEETNENSVSKDSTKAIIIFSNGNYYKVAYINGRKHSYGTYHSTDYEITKDQDADEKANGEGACTFKNGDCFIGTYKHGLRNGFGILYKKNGLIQIGVWANDQLEKESARPSSSGFKYSWIDSEEEKHYYGIYYADNGNKFIGNIIDGKAHGLGVRLWSDGSWYQGSFKNDKKHGYGIYGDTDRATYVGEWEDDKMEGFGKIIWKSKTKYEGNFKNGKRHGQGKLIFVNNDLQEGTWENDEYIDEK